MLSRSRFIRKLTLTLGATMFGALSIAASAPAKPDSKLLAEPRHGNVPLCASRAPECLGSKKTLIALLQSAEDSVPVYKASVAKIELEYKNKNQVVDLMPKGPARKAAREETYLWQKTSREALDEAYEISLQKLASQALEIMRAMPDLQNSSLNLKYGLLNKAPADLKISAVGRHSQYALSAYFTYTLNLPNTNTEIYHPCPEEIDRDLGDDPTGRPKVKDGRVIFSLNWPEKVGKKPRELRLDFTEDVGVEHHQMHECGNE